MIAQAQTHLFRCLLCGLAVAAGCAEPTEGTLSGEITVDGNPAETGYIGFVPVDGKSGTAGAAITAGEYTSTMPFGSYRVEIRVPKIVGQTKIYDTPDSPIQDVMVESLPPWYNDETELTAEVVEGETIQDFELSTSKKRKR